MTAAGSPAQGWVGLWIRSDTSLCGPATRRAVHMAVLVRLDHMKTTVNLDDELLRAAKRRAAARGTTLTAIIEESLREALTAKPTAPYSFAMPVIDGGAPPLIDVANRRTIYDVLDTDE